MFPCVGGVTRNVTICSGDTSKCVTYKNKKRRAGEPGGRAHFGEGAAAPGPGAGGAGLAEQGRRWLALSWAWALRGRPRTPQRVSPRRVAADNEQPAFFPSYRLQRGEGAALKERPCVISCREIQGACTWTPGVARYPGKYLHVCQMRESSVPTPPMIPPVINDPRHTASTPCSLLQRTDIGNNN